MVIFHGYVSLPEGIVHNWLVEFNGVINIIWNNG